MQQSGRARGPGARRSGSGGREELSLGEEGLLQERRIESASQGSPRVRRWGEQRRLVLGRERAEIEHEDGTSAKAVGQPGHSPLRGWLVRALGGEPTNGR